MKLQGIKRLKTNIMNPKISVIIPVYNGQSTLEHSLKSVCTQSLTDIEIICVNDGSTDNSLALLTNAQKKDERIRIINQQNQGAGAARNAGIDAACGMYCCFFDPDDLYPSTQTLEHFYLAATSKNAEICGGSFSSFLDDPKKPHMPPYPASLWGYVFENDGFISYLDYQFDYGYHRFLYKKEFLDRHRLRFPSYRRYQDPPFFARAMIAAKQFYALHEASYLYHVQKTHIAWTPEKTYAFLQGCIDVLSLSYENSLERLHALTMARVYENYKHGQKEIFAQNDARAHELIEQVRQAAHTEILIESDFVTKDQFEQSLTGRFKPNLAYRALRKAKRKAQFTFASNKN